MPQARPKIFILDTNVILHDAGCILNFEENDVVVPIAVLEELDHFKRGNGDINLQAREFLRSLDELTGDVLSAAGVPLGDGRGSLRVVLGAPVDPHLTAAAFLAHDSVDHRILNAALVLQRNETGRRVILVTKDTNLRMKAKSLGVRAEDYTTDKVESFATLYRGRRVVEDIPEGVLDAFFGGDGEVAAVQLPAVTEPIANENFVLRNGSKSVLATYREPARVFSRVRKAVAYGIRARNAEQSFALRALTDDDIQLVTLLGRAGTGKTLLALAAALECRSRYRQILLSRPVVPLSNRDLGYLPGDIAAKLDPYVQPLHDNLGVIRHELGDQEAAAQRIERLRETEKLVITPLAYIRGRSLQRMYFIVDEAQNLTPHEVKTILTRAGEGTKVVFTGDIHQIDQPYLDSLSNGLSYLISRMMGQSIYAHVTLEKGERSALADLASQLL